MGKALALGNVGFVKAFFPRPVERSDRLQGSMSFFCVVKRFRAQCPVANACESSRIEDRQLMLCRCSIVTRASPAPAAGITPAAIARCRGQRSSVKIERQTKPRHSQHSHSSDPQRTSAKTLLEESDNPFTYCICTAQCSVNAGSCGMSCCARLADFAVHRRLGGGLAWHPSSSARRD